MEKEKRHLEPQKWAWIVSCQETCKAPFELGSTFQVNELKISHSFNTRMAHRCQSKAQFRVKSALIIIIIPTFRYHSLPRTDIIDGHIIDFSQYEAFTPTEKPSDQTVTYKQGCTLKSTRCFFRFP